MNALEAQVYTLQPLLVTKLGAGEENSATAFHFIPGSVLRGMVINRYLREYQPVDAAQDPTCRRLFFDGAVRYLNAYPLNRLGQRTLPKPLSWRVTKEKRDDLTATIYDFAIEPNHKLDNPVSPTGIFCWREGEDVEIDTPDRHINVHNASENRQVKRKDNSTVYRYEAIAAGELFGVTILAEDEADLEILRPFLDGAEVNLGGSRSAGYGLVRFESTKFVPDWREYERDDEPDNGIVVLTLLSDAILRDQYGQFTTDLDIVLGWEHLRTYAQTRVAGGFNRKWGLPLTQSPALRAGSVFVYRADQMDLQVLRCLEKQGIGERISEGFGRIGINWHTQDTLRRRRSEPRRHILQVVPLSKGSQELAQQMAEQRLRAVLDRKLIEAVSQLKITNPLPHNTQLSRLRLAVRRAWREEKSDTVIEHLNNLKGAKEQKEQFERARIGNQRLYSWLMNGVHNDRLWESWLQPTELPSIAGVTAQITGAIKVEYTMRLLDALLRKTLRQERLEEGGAT